MGTTTIEVSVENYKRLNAQKGPGESFNDVVGRLLDESDGDGDGGQEAGEKPPVPVMVDTEEIDVPGSGDAELARQEAVAQLYAYLRTEGSATKSDFLELVDAGEVQYGSLESFWSNCIKSDYRPLHSLPGVSPPPEGGRTWRYQV